MTEYAEIVQNMRDSQIELLEAIEARMEVEFPGDGKAYAEVVREVSNTFSVLRLFAISDRQFKQAFTDAGVAVIVCGVYKLKTVLHMLELTRKQEQEFMDTVHMFSNKQVKFISKRKE